ncbi:competence protein ComA [Pasteurellaceae bacterium 22721_9_1]
MLKKIKKLIKIQVGVWLTEDNFEFVWFNDKNQPHFCLLNKHIEQGIAAIIIEKVQSSLSTNLPIKLCFVTALLPHQIWQKSLILPHHLNEQECEHQCRYSLEKELPVPLDELWFDYTTTPLKQGLRLDIFAIRIQIAQQHLALFAPLEIEVLDTAIHCLFKAIHYLQLEQSGTPSLVIYSDQQHCIIARNQSYEWQIMHKTNADLTALYHQFIQRYQEDIGHILLYQTQQTPIDLQQDYQVIETKFPLIALGAALWQKDVIQNENLS